MHKSASHIASKLDALRQEYAVQLTTRFDTIEALWRQLCLESWSDVTLNALFLEIHRLSGSAATFGFERLSAASVAVERIVKPWTGLSARPAAEELEAVDRLIARLRVDVASDVPDRPSFEQD